MRRSPASLAWVALLPLFAAAPAGAQRHFDTAAIYRVPAGGRPARGLAAAPVTIVEFSDFRCAACASAQVTLQQVLALHGDAVRLVYRHLPLDADGGTLPAEAAELAAEQGLFWPMHDRLFGAEEALDRSRLETIAAELGLDMTRFRRGLTQGRARSAVLADLRLASSLGIASTPMFFINGRPLRGAQPLGVFLRVIERERARAEALRRSGVPDERLYEALIAGGESRASSGAAAEQVSFAGLERDRVYPVGLGVPYQRQGPEDALVTVVAFSDFQCPFCSRAAATLDALRQRLPDTVRVVHRHLPLEFHPDAALAAEAAMAAGEQGKFWPYHQLLFVHQRDLGRSALERHASQLGLDLVRFRRALDERRYREPVLAEAAEAAAFGVTGTPTLFVNGTPLVGARPLAELVALVERKEAEARALLAAGVPRAALYAAVVEPHTLVRSAEQACARRDRAAAGALYRLIQDPGARAALRGACDRAGLSLPP
jgi:protein-disulfide isomerase